MSFTAEQRYQGGLTTSKRGPGYYSEIGKKGGRPRRTRYSASKGMVVRPPSRAAKGTNTTKGGRATASISREAGHQGQAAVVHHIDPEGFAS